MKMNLLKKITLNLGLVFLALSPACGGDSGTQKIKSSLPSESPGSFDPSGGVTPPSENPVENCTTTEDITYSPKTINFGLGQISTADFNTRECQTVTVNPCFELVAQIDPQSSQSEIADANNPSQKTAVAEFEIGSKTAKGQAEICYQRQALGSHTGKAIVTLNGNYTFAIPLSGQTLPSIFSISNPKDNLYVTEAEYGPVQKGGDNVPYNEYLNVAFNGGVDVTSYASLLEGKNKEVSVSVTNGGITQTVPFNDQGQYSGKLQIPNVPRVYPVNFSINTTKGNLMRRVRIIRASAPTTSLEIRARSDGSLVNVASTSDSKKAEITNNPSLVAGLVVSNLDVSGPDAKHPVFTQFKITKSYPKSGSPKVLVYRGGKWNDGDSGADPEEVMYYKNIVDPKTGDIQKCSVSGFTDNTLCIDMPHTGELGDGINQIEAITCNDITGTDNSKCIKSKATIIVNNNLPNIVIQTPIENCVYPIDGGTPETACATNSLNSDGDIILRGYIENYAPSVISGEKKDIIDCAVGFWLNQAEVKDTDNRLVDKNTGKPYCPTPVYTKDNKGDTQAAIDESYQKGNQKNVKKGTFEINLSKEFPKLLTRYTNLIQIRAQNVLGHVAYKTVSFQQGKFNRSSIKDRGNVKDIISGQLGFASKNNKKTMRSPLMLNISEETLNLPEVKAAIEKILNDPEDGIRFADIVQGGKLPGDEDGDNFEDKDEVINFEKTLGLTSNQTFWNASDPKKKEWIWQNLHASMPQKVRALTRYRTYQGLTGKVSTADIENVFFDGQCNKNDPANFEKGWNVACDSCQNRITTALVSYDTMQYIYEGISDPQDLLKRRDWPAICKDDYNCRGDIVQGKWKIGDIKLKENGFIDADICVVGQGDVVDGCDDVPDDNIHQPAFWGHMAAVSLIKGGITKLENDPLLPLIWNVGKVRITLKDALQIEKVKLSDGAYTNKLTVHKDKLADGIAGSIQLEPFTQCAEYHRQKYGKDLIIPFGCSDTGENYPVVIDRNTLSGQTAWHELSTKGKDPWLLIILRDKLLETFKNMIHCLVNEMVNPIINPDAFKYQPWVIDEDKIDLNIAIEKDDDGEGIKISQLKDAKDPILTFLPNIKDADILSDTQGIKIKLPMSVGANNIDVSKFDTQMLGHLFRDTSTEFEDTHPLSEIQDKPYLSVSLGLEELVHSATNVLLKKGITPLLDLFDVTDFAAADHHAQNDWTIGLDSVIFGRLDICGSMANKLLATDLPPNTLFSEMTSFFKANFAHWDIELDPKAPITINMKSASAWVPDAVDENEETKPTVAPPSSSTMLEVGLSNIRISAYDFTPTVSNPNIWKVGREPIVTVRLDGILKLRLDYFKDRRFLTIKVMPLSETPLYTTVIYKGSLYDDSKVLKDIKETLLPQAFTRLSSGAFEVTIPERISKFDTVATGRLDTQEVIEGLQNGNFVFADNTDLGKNGSCDGLTLPEYAKLATNITLSRRNSDMVNYSKPDLKVTGNSYVDLMPGQTMQNYKGIDLNNMLAPSTTTGTTPEQVPSMVEQVPSKGTTEMPASNPFDPCNNYDMLQEIAGNDIKESLCDLGIKDISFGTDNPNVVLDPNNGYIHLSTELFIEIYDWLRNGDY